MNNDLQQDPRASAVERLASTRARMRMSLHESMDPRPDDGSKPSVLMTALMGIPGVNIVIESVRNWWAQHPLHLATLVASGTVRSAVRPIARNNPYGLILAAMAVGGLVFWVKPWRGLLKPALLAGLVPHLVSRAMAHVPMESWVNALMTMATQQHPASAGSGAASEPAATASAESAAPAGPVAAARQPESPPTQKPAGPLH